MSLRSDAENAILQNLLIPLQNEIAAAVLPLFQLGGAYAGVLCAYSATTLDGFNVSVSGYNDVAGGNIVIKLYAEDVVFGRNCNISWTYRQSVQNGATTSTTDLTDLSAAQFAPYNVSILAGGIVALTAFLNSINAQIASNKTLPAPVVTVPFPVAPAAPTAYNVTIKLQESATDVVTTGTNYTVTALGSTTLAQWQAIDSTLVAVPTVGQAITTTAAGTIAGGATVTLVTPATPASQGLVMNQTQTAQISVTPVPSYNLTYQNTNSGVISISNTGLVTAIGKGSAQIQVGQFTDGDPQFETINIYVPF